MEGRVAGSDGTSQTVYFMPNRLNRQVDKLPKWVYSTRFDAVAGVDYSLRVHPEAALASQLTRAARMTVSREPNSLSEMMIGVGLLSAVGATLWLVAYGVFLAAAVRIAFNWRDAADAQHKTRSAPDQTLA